MSCLDAEISSLVKSLVNKVVLATEEMERKERRNGEKKWREESSDQARGVTSEIPSDEIGPDGQTVIKHYDGVVITFHSPENEKGGMEDKDTEAKGNESSMYC
ncbi:MAG: hypothetical protein GY821_08630 [Gammaproteobacteria bacterium]|nr:hypothetical protein [Gammaproteobacteria bacterium]